jgi:hypothetical protein
MFQLYISLWRVVCYSRTGQKKKKVENVFNGNFYLEYNGSILFVSIHSYLYYFMVDPSTVDDLLVIWHFVVNPQL